MKKKVVGDDGKTYVMKERKPFYKRVWFIVLAVIVGLLIIGNLLGEETEGPKLANQEPAGQVASEQSTEETNQEEPVVEEEKEIIFTVGDTVENDKMQFTLTKVEAKTEVTDESGYISFKPNSDSNSYLVLDVKMKNITNEAITLDSSGFKLFKGEAKYSPTTMLIDTALNLETINPGTEIERQIFFDVPTDVTEADDLRVEIESGIFSRSGQTIVIHLN